MTATYTLLFLSLGNFLTSRDLAAQLPLYNNKQIITEPQTSRPTSAEIVVWHSGELCVLSSFDKVVVRKFDPRRRYPDVTGESLIIHVLCTIRSPLPIGY